MKINLSEIKKWTNIEKEFETILLTVIDNWNNDSYKNSIERNTLMSYKFIKKDIIDLKELEVFDEYLFEIASNLFLKSYIMKDNDGSNVRFDVNKISLLSEEEILAIHDDESISSTDNKKSIYYKSLKSYGFLNAKGEVDVDILNRFNKIKKSFIINSLDVIKNYGLDWNVDVLTALIKMNIISE